jgi:hypothetical protein
MSNNSSVLIKIDTDTKERMSKLKINWSEAIRQFIKGKLDSSKNIALAVALNDKILGGQKKSKGDTIEIIRKFRDARYGKGSS